MGIRNIAESRLEPRRGAPDERGGTRLQTTFAIVAGTSGSTLVMFPIRANRTQRTGFPHPSLVQDPAVAHAAPPPAQTR